MKQTKFRSWLHNVWVDNCEEHQSYGELPYTMQEYFSKYKYWLKREFKFQQRKENARRKENAN